MREHPNHMELYLGEPKERHPWVAFFLTFLCPGLGALYLGKLLKGVLICLLYVVAFGLFVLAWSEFKFFPILPLVVLLSGLFGVSLSLASAAAREASRVRADYILRGSNHTVVYALVAMVFFALPLLGLARYTGERLWAFIWVDTEAMFPTLVKGDLILVDRTHYHEQMPRPGDLVMVRVAGQSNAIGLGRVIAVPGDEVEVHGAVPIINGIPLVRSMLQPGDPETETQFAALLDVTLPSNALTFIEQNGEAQYLTAELPTELGVVIEPARLGRDEYYVVHDNRTQYGDSRDYGPVARRDIVGQPLYIAYSASAEDGLRWGRLAKRVQPEPFSR